MTPLPAGLGVEIFADVEREHLWLIAAGCAGGRGPLFRWRLLRARRERRRDCRRRSSSLPLGSTNTGHNFHLPSTFTFFKTLTLVLAPFAPECNMAAIVRPQRISRKILRGWTPRWTPNPKNVD